MPGALTPRERAALKAAADAGLIRGRSGFYPGFSTVGTAHATSTVRALMVRGLIRKPDALSPRRIITDAGRAAGELPAPAKPRAYVD